MNILGFISAKKATTLFSLLLLICSLGVLSGCSSEYLPHIPALEKKNKAERMLDKEMEESTSHMSPKIGSVVPPRPRDRNITRGKLNPKNMFGGDLRSDSERLDRLERAVQDMRNDFDRVSPSIRRLMAVEGDIQDLIVELRKLSDDPAMASPLLQTNRRAHAPQQRKQPVAQTPMPESVQPQAVAHPKPKAKTIARKAPPPVQGGKASVYDIRVGEHSGKTRIVLDVNSKTNFSTDIDNGEKIMIVELPNTGWSTATSKNFAKSSYLTSYKVEPSGDGQLLIFQLKRNARIAYKEDIGGANGGRRIVIDLAGS